MEYSWFLSSGSPMELLVKLWYENALTPDKETFHLPSYWVTIFIQKPPKRNFDLIEQLWMPSWVVIQKLPISEYYTFQITRLFFLRPGTLTHILITLRFDPAIGLIWWEINAFFSKYLTVLNSIINSFTYNLFVFTKFNFYSNFNYL